MGWFVTLLIPLLNIRLSCTHCVLAGAGVLFGNTGGVMEAAVRTVYEVVTGKVRAVCGFLLIQ
jgi:hypothetical protein